MNYNGRRLYIQKYVVSDLFLVNIKRLLEHHSHFLDQTGLTYFSQYQTALDKVRCFISFKSNIHNMNGIFLAIAFIA